MKSAAEHLAVVRAFMERVTHWQEGKPDRHDAMQALNEADDEVEWIEKGVVEWRDEAARFLAVSKDRREQRDELLSALREIEAQTVAGGTINSIVRAAIAKATNK